MPGIKIDEAILVGLFSEAILYGIFLATFGECLRALFWRSGSFQAGQKVRRAFLVVTCAMCFVATFDIVLNIIHNLDAFVHYDGPGGPKTYLSNLSYWINVARGSLLAAQTLIGDAVLIYRVYIIYSHKCYVMLPLCLMWVGVAVAGFGIPIVESTFDSNQPAGLTASRLNDWTNSVTAIEVGLNVLGTSLIAYRIWSVARRTPVLPGGALGQERPLHYALRIMVESGTMYTSGEASLLGLSIAKSNAQYIVTSMLVPLIGICFNLIIVRVNWHHHHDPAPAPVPPPQDIEARTNRGIFGIPVHLAHFAKSKARSHSSGKASSGSEPIRVAVSQRIEYDGGSSLGTTNSGNSDTRQMWAAS